MKADLEQKLYEDFKEFFVQKDCSIQESCMPWGCDISDGWHDLLRTACEEIENHYKNNRRNIQYWHKTENERNPPWSWRPSILYAKLKALRSKPIYPKPEEIPPFEFTQIKEKYGSLRLYYQGGDSFIDGVISFAEMLSYKICENCGNPGKPNDRGWIKTLCDSCSEK